MKGKIIAAGLLAALAVGQNADAKSLEDILKEKGVITESDYKEVTKYKPLDYKLGKGFTFTSADEKFQLALGGRMQFRYTFTDFDTADFSTKSDSSTWDAKRIKLFLNGHAYTKDLTYKLELDVRQAGNSKMLQDAFLNCKFIDEAQLRAGQYKVPFARQELISDGALSFVDRSPVVDAFKASYDLGAMAHGKIAGGFAEYNLGVFGGLGQTTPRASNDNMFAARVAVNPLGDMPFNEPDFAVSKKPLLSIGANYFMNTLQNNGTSFEGAASNYATSGWLGAGRTFVSSTGQKVSVDSYGVDLAFKWMGLAIQGEYLLGQAENDVTDKKLRAQGFYAQAAYMILPKLETAFRYSYYDPNRDVSDNLKTEVIGAVSYYFDKHNLKLTADVGNIHTQGGKTNPFTGLNEAADDMQYRLQAQIIF